MRHCVSEAFDKKMKKLMEENQECCCDTKYSILNDIDDDACICEPEEEFIEDEFSIKESTEGAMSAEEAKDQARKEAYEIGLTGPGYTNYVNRRSRELIMGEDLTDAPVDESIIDNDPKIDEALITEGKWELELKTGPALRKAINSENAEATANALVDCYNEIINSEQMSEDDRYDFVNALEDLRVVFANGESGPLDRDTYESEDELNDTLDYYLNEFYDLCDGYRIWIPLEECVNESKLNEEVTNNKYAELNEDLDLIKISDYARPNPRNPRAAEEGQQKFLQDAKKFEYGITANNKAYDPEGTTSDLSTKLLKFAGSQNAIRDKFNELKSEAENNPDQKLKVIDDDTIEVYYMNSQSKVIYHLTKLDIKESLRVHEAFSDKDYDENEWEPEDIELHKSINWKDRNYEDYPVEGSEIDDEATLYAWDKEPEIVPVKMKKFLRSNPIYPPYYRAEESPFAKRRGVVGSMYNGKKHGKYGIHNRYEDQKTYDMLSETLNEDERSPREMFDDYCQNKIAEDLGVIEFTNELGEEHKLPVLMIGDIKDFEDVRITRPENNEEAAIYGFDSNGERVINSPMIDVTAYAARMEFKQISSSFYDELIKDWNDLNMDEMINDKLSESLKEGRDIMKYNSVGKMLYNHKDEIDMNADEATLKRQLLGLLNNYQSEISDKKGLIKAREIFTKARGPRLLSTVSTYLTGDKVTEAAINRKATAGDKFRAYMKKHQK